MPLETPGQNASYTFSGTNAQAIRVQLSGGYLGTFPCVTMKLRRRDPANQNNWIDLTQTSGCGGFELPYTLPATDTYTITIDPIGNSKGTATVRVISP